MNISDYSLTEPVQQEESMSFGDLNNLVFDAERILSELDDLMSRHSNITAQDALDIIIGLFGFGNGSEQHLFDRSTSKAKVSNKLEEKDIVQESDIDSLLAKNADKVESKLMYSTVLEFPVKDFYNCASCRTKKIQKGDTHCPQCNAKLLWMEE